MSLTNLLKICLILFTLFALGEAIFTFQRYGKDLFKPKPGSCEILEERYCSQAKFKEFNNKKYVVFNLPSGTPLFSFLSGERTTIPKVTAKNSPFLNQSELLINTKDNNTFGIFVGRIKFSTNPIVAKGQDLAVTYDDREKIFGDYNLIFTADKGSVSRLFPKIQ